MKSIGKILADTVLVHVAPEGGLADLGDDLVDALLDGEDRKDDTSGGGSSGENEHSSDDTSGGDSGESSDGGTWVYKDGTYSMFSIEGEAERVDVSDDEDQ